MFFISGAGRGLGHAMAKNLAKLSGKLALIDLDQGNWVVVYSESGESLVVINLESRISAVLRNEYRNAQQSVPLVFSPVRVVSEWRAH
ncbi:hypothetical protein ACMXYN_00510 [Neptuniibacter sp. PT8_73]|uniref:hypothetical protein n=1 Tax=unclassified Neptuniibacter TaxID=2630693 RepID=UPI0039F66DA3